MTGSTVYPLLDQRQILPPGQAPGELVKSDSLWGGRAAMRRPELSGGAGNAGLIEFQKNIAIRICVAAVGIVRRGRSPQGGFNHLIGPDRCDNIRGDTDIG